MLKQGWKRRAAGLALAAGAVSAMVGIVVEPAAAVVLSMSPNATLSSGQSRQIGAAWGVSAPYQVNFQCHLSGCANYVTSSTSTNQLYRVLSLGSCSAYTSTATISITEHDGGSASASTTTTWLAGHIC